MTTAIHSLRHYGSAYQNSDHSNDAKFFFLFFVAFSMNCARACKNDLQHSCCTTTFFLLATIIRRVCVFSVHDYI